MGINKQANQAHSDTFNRPTFQQDIYPYKSKEKLPEPTVCKQCGAVYHNGHWQWMEAPADAHQEVCSACHRINDNYPAGYVTLKGRFFEAHCAEIKQLIQNLAEHERTEHPYKRIMSMERQNGTLKITTTDTHLARGIGEALHKAYQGELKVDDGTGENLVRIHWIR
jgi:NMD protein affecting ribosome stability and mRNA decay